MLYSSKELTILSTDWKGITIDNQEDKKWDNLTFHCSGSVWIAGGKPSYHIFCKFVTPDGDIVVGESVREGPEGTWKFLHATGKWKGITGGGKNWTVRRGKPAASGTSQTCSRATGTYQLPK